MYDGPEAAIIAMGLHSADVSHVGAGNGGSSDGSFVAVPLRLDTLQGLSALGIPVPSPMAGYDWPCRRGEKPMEIQKITAGFLTLNPRSFCLSEMRTGKTRASLWAADWLMQRHKGMKCLIVANLSTLKRTWGKEIFENFIGRRKYVVLHSHSSDARKKLLGEDADYFIINHDGVGVGAATGRRGVALRGFAEMLAARKDIAIAILP